MDVPTSRFGKLQASPTDILFFEQGLIGLRHCRRWIVLADAQNPALAWLQCVDDADVALGVVSPRRFLPEFQLRASRRELASLGLKSVDDAHVVAAISRRPEGLCLNLRAPLVINVASRRGRQVVAGDVAPAWKALPAFGELRLTA
jgi:flagellar assembly factor FliW